MKLKYYLRGLGSGIIITTIILAVSFSQREAAISDEEVMARAEALGMVMQAETEAETQTETEDTETEDTGTEPQTETEGTETEPQPETEAAAPESAGSYSLLVEEGDACETISRELEKQGVIEDAWALQTYLLERGYASSIRTGQYDVPYGLTMEEVAQIIIAGPTG